jgi:hypothetical protein
MLSESHLHDALPLQAHRSYLRRICFALPIFFADTPIRRYAITPVVAPHVRASLRCADIYKQRIVNLVSYKLQNNEWIDVSPAVKQFFSAGSLTRIQQQPGDALSSA